jgi:hypothetical protein
MPSPDGHGRAKSKWQHAWDVYKETANRVAGPVLMPAIMPIANTLTFDVMGFWLAWRLEGGYEGLQKQTGMSRSAMYRRLNLFRRATGKHPDDFEIPGVEIDLVEYFKGMQAQAAAKAAAPERSTN